MAQRLHSSLQNEEYSQQFESPEHHSPPKQSIVGQVKKIDQSLLTAKNRVSLLRSQLQMQKKKIRKNQELTKQVLKKKSSIGQINSYKKRDNSGQLYRLNQLKKRNHSFRLSHQKSLQDIRKAIYLVKLDDARQVKNVSEKLKRQLKQKQDMSAIERKNNREERKKQAQRAKQRYMKYWKNKLHNIYAKNDEFALEMNKNKERKAQQLKELQEEQLRLLSQIQKQHQKQVQSKKQYLAAVSLSAKDVAEVMNNNQQVQKSHSVVQIRTKTPKLSKKYTHQKIPQFGPAIKIPHANVDQNKLKIILKQLKRIDKSKQKHHDRYQVDPIREEEVQTAQMHDMGI